MKIKDILYTLPVLLLPVLVLLAGPRDPAWVRMWTLAFAFYFGCKILTLRDLPPKTPFRGLGIYLLLWPGMDPAAFLQTHLQTHLLDSPHSIPTPSPRKPWASPSDSISALRAFVACFSQNPRLRLGLKISRPSGPEIRQTTYHVGERFFQGIKYVGE